MSETKVQRAILVFVGVMDEMKLAKMKSIMNSHNVNAFFYMVYKTATSGSVNNDKGMADDSPNYYMTWDQVRIQKEATDPSMPLQH